MTVDRGARERTDAPIPDDRHDAFAYADGGEHATVWGVDRLDETTVEVSYYRFETGLDHREPGTERFTVEPETETVAWAEELAEADPQQAVEIAREHWTSEESP